MNEYVCLLGWGGELRPASQARSPLPMQNPGIQADCPPRPLGPLVLPLPAFQPVFPLLGSVERPGFRGEGLGSDTEPSLLHPPPRSGPPSLPATTVRVWPAAGKEERSEGGGGKTQAPSDPIRAEPQGLGSEIREASTRGPNSADHACGEPQAGPSGELGPPWGPRAPYSSSLGWGAGVQRPGPQPPPLWRLRAAEPPAPSSPLS